MWLKILTPSSGGRVRSLGRSNKKDKHEDDDPNATDMDCLLKKKSKPSNRLMSKGSDSSKVPKESRSPSSDKTKMSNNKGNAKASNTSTTTDSTSTHTGDSKEGRSRSYKAHSSAPPYSDLMWKDTDLERNYIDPFPEDPEPSQKDPKPISFFEERHFQCDLSCLTDDLNTVHAEDPTFPQPKITLDDVKLVSKAALTQALWCGGLVLEAGKTAGVAIYEKSRAEMARGNSDVEGTALEITSTTTQTTTSDGSSVSSEPVYSMSESQSPEDEYNSIILTQRLTKQTQKARTSRRNRLQQVHQRSSKVNTPSNRRLGSRKREVVSRNQEEISIKSDHRPMDEESTILIEEGNDCFLMTKDDVDDLVATFQALTGSNNKDLQMSDALCDCDTAKNAAQWFLSPSQKDQHDHSELFQQAAEVIMCNKHFMAPETTAKRDKNTTCFVDDDMQLLESHDTDDSSTTGRTPKIQNRNPSTKFVDEDMPSTPSSVMRKRKTVLIQTTSGVKPVLQDMITNETVASTDDNKANEHKFQPTDTIRTDDLVVACGGEAGQSEDTIETVLVSDEKTYGCMQVADSEYGEDAEDEDIYSCMVPHDEATDATQCGDRHHSKGFLFDVDQNRDWDFGQYKKSSRDGAKLPTIHEVDIDTIIFENDDEEDDFFSFDLSSITPDSADHTADHTIDTATTGTGEHLSPVPPPTMKMRKGDMNSKQMELKRRLMEIEAELSELQGQYNQIGKSYKTVETQLKVPSEPSPLEHSKEDEAKPCELVEPLPELLSESPLSDLKDSSDDNSCEMESELQLEAALLRLEIDLGDYKTREMVEEDQTLEDR